MFEKLVAELAMLGVNVGIVDSISGRWPDEVRERWEQKQQSIIDFAQDQISEVQQFAQHWDD